MNSSSALLSCRIVAFGFGNLPGLQMEPEPESEPEKRMDDTKYSPGRWTERKYQATWREAVIEEATSHEEVKNSHSQEERPPFRELRRTIDPTRRLQRIAIPANQFISEFISTQSKNKRRHLEAAADRKAFDGYQPI
ncbi:uncharacterized protein LOC122611488 isoform X2 [Drosophila teissieri]|uniref:uncharacterized protein LOC122611488 isoform X2 n=1 Tax=Drosophila teissieri TaxID=7243 RepID=UPI001CBA56D9|nr:uncharacterized protein LOC122611488 isoform X2 [Drosophila teissieri]